MSGKTFVIVNAFGRSNRGDAVLLDQCIDQIRLFDARADIRAVTFEGIASASAVHPDVRWSERLGNSEARGALTPLFKIANLVFAWGALRFPALGMERLLPPTHRQTIEAYRQADVVVSAPGGYIHDTNFAYLIALFHIWLGKLVGARVVLAPQSVGPLTSRLARWLARHVLADCDALCVREGYSRDFLLKDLALPRDRVFDTGDGAFWDFDVMEDTTVTDAALADIGLAPGERFVGMTAVDWNFPNLADPAGLRARYHAGMARVIRHIHARTGLRVVIFNQVASDLTVGQEIATASEGAALVNLQNFEPGILRAMIARSEIFIGTRFHSCIFALMASRPVLAIAYLPKTEYIMHVLKLSHHVVDIADFDAERVMVMADDMLDRAPEVSAQVRAAVDVYRQEQRQLQDILRLVA